MSTAARAWLDGTAGPASPSRDASTVLLLRDAVDPGDGGGVEVFMIMRASTMAFAPSVYVFPGGGVDPRDADDALPWVGPSPAAWAQVLGTDDEAHARELVVAAAREVFEECGVLLAGPDASSVVADLTDPRWAAARQSLLAREASFAELLIAQGLVLRTDLLSARARWVTPEFEPRRYDTRFFAALLPTGQTPDDASSEAAHVRWVRPADLLDDDQVALFPPTRVCLEELRDHAGTAAEFVGQRPDVRRIMPVLVESPDGATIRVDGLA